MSIEGGVEHEGSRQEGVELAGGRLGEVEQAGGEKSRQGDESRQGEQSRQARVDQAGEHAERSRAGRLACRGE